jgi:hypothetical protein
MVNERGASSASPERTGADRDPSESKVTTSIGSQGHLDRPCPLDPDIPAAMVGQFPPKVYWDVERFADEETARSYMVRVASPDWLTVWECSTCGGWHIGLDENFRWEPKGFGRRLRGSKESAGSEVTTKHGEDT